MDQREFSSALMSITLTHYSFYKEMGLDDEAFTYALVTTVGILFSQAIALYAYDKFGRRPIMITGAIIQVPLMIVVAAVGGRVHPTRASIHAVVACMIMFASFQRIATESPTYIICAEIGGVKLRKKSMNDSGLFVYHSG